MLTKVVHELIAGVDMNRFNLLDIHQVVNHLIQVGNAQHIKIINYCRFSGIFVPAG